LQNNIEENFIKTSSYSLGILLQAQTYRSGQDKAIDSTYLKLLQIED